jgi:hypothetical protein
MLVTPAGHVHTLTYGARGTVPERRVSPNAIASAATALQRPMHVTQSIAAPLANRIRHDRSPRHLRSRDQTILHSSWVRTRRQNPAVPGWLRNVTDSLRGSLHRSFTVAEIARIADVHRTCAFRRFCRARRRVSPHFASFATRVDRQFRAARRDRGTRRLFVAEPLLTAFAAPPDSASRYRRGEKMRQQ